MEKVIYDSYSSTATSTSLPTILGKTDTSSLQSPSRKCHHVDEEWSGRKLDEGQPCEQTGFRRGFSTVDQTDTVTRLIKVSQEYKTPLCLTFIDLKKAFDTVEIEAAVEVLGNQGVPTQYVRMLRELTKNFRTMISPFFKRLIINVKRGILQGNTISPKLSSAALENVMRHVKGESVGVKVDDRYLYHLRFR
uniref:Reverse transcriptase domain-containing protein n=1 Tax=Haemonchus contortus TaxID=6289 RepID=A0A7I4Z5D4_HAECO